VENHYDLIVETQDDELTVSEAAGELEVMIERLVVYSDEENFGAFIKAWREQWNSIGANSDEVSAAIERAIGRCWDSKHQENLEQLTDGYVVELNPNDCSEFKYYQQGWIHAFLGARA